MSIYNFGGNTVQSMTHTLSLEIYRRLKPPKENDFLHKVEVLVSFLGEKNQYPSPKYSLVCYLWLLLKFATRKNHMNSSYIFGG